MSRAVSTLCLLIFTGSADMSRILLERTGIVLAYIYILFSLQILCVISVWESSAEHYMYISASSYCEPQGNGQILLLRGFVEA